MKWQHRIWLVILFFFASAASFNGFYSECRFGEAGFPWADYPEGPVQNQEGFEQMVNGTTERPYIYRQLLLTTANWANDIAPSWLKTRLYQRLTKRQGTSGYWSVTLASSPTAMDERYSFRYVWIYLLTFLFAFIGTYAMYLVCIEMEIPLLVSVLAPILMILLVPYFMSMNGAMYDYPELAFIAIAVWLASKLRWWVVIPIAALGAWNKESFFFIIPTLYPFFRRRDSRRASLIGVCLLCLICGLIYVLIRTRYEHNPGGTVYFALFDQLQSFLHPRYLLISTEEAYGLRMIRMYSLIPMTLLVWATCRAWKKMPRALQRHAQIAAVINIPLYILFCGPGEMRDLSMLYVSLLFVIALNLDACFRDGEFLRFEPRSMDQSLP